MKSKAARLILCGAIILLVLACNLPLSSSGEATPTVSPTEMPSSGPFSYTELLQERIDSGQWTEGEGLLTLLRYFNGDVELPKTIGMVQELDQDLTAILAEARQYVKANPDAPESAEIERLLNSLVPDGNLLIPYAEEISSLSTLPAKLANPAYLPLRDWAACNDLWQNGFPTPAPGTAPLICFDVYYFTTSGVTFRVFIERSWLNADVTRRMDLLRWASDALSDAGAYYSLLSMAGILPTDLVFNQLDHHRAGTNEPDPNTEMAATHDALRTKCFIGIFPSSLNLDELYFKQDVAHEMFHCFQFKDIVDLNTASVNDILWWLEGSAEYFGNTVYPDYNEEYRRIAGLDAAIWGVNTFHLDYMNFLFFQYMGNGYTSDRDVINVLKRLPHQGDNSAFASALVTVSTSQN